MLTRRFRECPEVDQTSIGDVQHMRPLEVPLDMTFIPVSVVPYPDVVRFWRSTAFMPCISSTVLNRKNRSN